MSQDNWRFCTKCYALFFYGYPTAGQCASGGAHSPLEADSPTHAGTSWDFALQIASTSPPPASPGGTAVPPPLAGLGSNSNYLLYSGCSPLDTVEVIVQFGDEMVADNGYTFQLNAYSAESFDDAAQQYVVRHDANTNQLWAQVDNFAADQEEIVNYSTPLATALPLGTILNGYQLSIRLTNDQAGNVTQASYTLSAYDNSEILGSASIRLADLTLDNGNPLTAAYLAPIVAFQFNIVGPGNGQATTFSSCGGQITYTAISPLTPLADVPTCVDLYYVTAETANTQYGKLNQGSSLVIKQTFTQALTAINSQPPGVIKRKTPIPPTSAQ